MTAGRLSSPAESAKKAVVIGATFIGTGGCCITAHAALEVDVVRLEKTPLERVVGPELGSYVQNLHEFEGVKFHLDNCLVRVSSR